MRYNFKSTLLLALALAAERLRATMGYVDAQTLLCDAQAFAVAGTYASTNTYDTDTATNDIAPGEPLAIEISVDVAAGASGGNETYAFNVIQSAAANLGTPTILNTMTIARATLVAGYKFYLPVTAKSQRYLGLSLTIAGTTPTITITASIKAARYADALRYYPVGYTIA